MIQMIIRDLKKTKEQAFEKLESVGDLKDHRKTGLEEMDS